MFRPPYDDLAFGFDPVLAMVVIFFFLFVVLVIWLRREDKREGYPADTAGAFSSVRLLPNWIGMPGRKVFHRPHGNPPVSTPRREPLRESGARPPRAARGRPFRPVLDGLKEGVGPASWQNREEKPDLDRKGRPKIIPLSSNAEYFVAEGDPDPRGWLVRGADFAVAGEVKDLWFNRAEFFLRYLDVELEEGGRRLVPLFFTITKPRRGEILVPHLPADRFRDAPTLASPDRITMREEDRVNAFFAGAAFYGKNPRGGDLRL
ncbi:photosynthetic reaction center H subunit [Hasllibacter halocynthiae]|uniref:Photosynthetic reaction center H subunit n=1 Tax=Hasllibacter halocynthiae TaxID=595589 RepID=A0A2T0WZC8_9RHOB|nr:photosynthetic reaction center subunit H [Hasllibacter halocynthiae]PRY92041.1 photosynthetic reaction center H subunit [Hasllibacter halocynthiae]